MPIYQKPKLVQQAKGGSVLALVKPARQAEDWTDRYELDFDDDEHCAWEGGGSGH